MHYDEAFFDIPIDRQGTASEKWEGLAQRTGHDLLPMWVADMDFRCPTEVAHALQNRAMHPVYGYTQQTAAQTEALLSFLHRRHGLSLRPEHCHTLPCVISGLCTAVRALTAPGDRVIIQPPVYGPFYAAVENNGRTLLENPLLRDDKGQYTMDFDHLESLCREGATLMLLCSPHNPVGRCWTKEELSRLLGILSRYHVALFSDEIHWDFVYEPDAFTSVLAMPEAQDPTAKIAVATSASKTFNLAGLLQAALLTRNPELMQGMKVKMKSAGMTQGNLFSLIATQTAYQEGDAWLDTLLSYLKGSRDFLEEQLRRRLPGAVLSPVEATYLGWIDFRAYGFSEAQLISRTHGQGVALTEGSFFDKTTGEGFLRLNFACPRGQLRDALIRLENAIKESISSI